MLKFHCPHCDEVREEEEFSYAGEAYIARPVAPDGSSDAEWGDYLFMRSNPKGVHHEQWRHASGCGRWFNVLRDTVSSRIHATSAHDGGGVVIHS